MRAGGALLVSLGVHGALAMVALRAPIAPPPTIELRPLTFELEETRAAPTPVEPTPPTPTPEPDAEPSRREPRVRALARSVPRGASAIELREPEPEPMVVEPGPVAPMPGPPEPSGPTPAQLRALIDPRGVARRFYVPTGPGPSQRGPAASRELETNTPTERELEVEHGGYLRARAMAREWLSRSEPELRRQPDGSYLYDGHAFQARIRPDGSVDFDARENIRIDEPSLQNIPFDLDNMIHDVYRYERDRFMEHTEELRDELEAAHRAQTNTEALRVLPGRLASIWRRTTRSAVARRRQVFELWDQAEDDEVGREARAIVVRWVRETLPLGSDDAYSAEELARLNAARESTAAFDPY